MDKLSKDKMRISFAIDRRLREKLRIVADKEGLSSSALITKLVSNYIKRNYRDVFDSEVKIDKPKETKKKSKDEWSW